MDQILINEKAHGRDAWSSPWACTHLLAEVDRVSSLVVVVGPRLHPAPLNAAIAVTVLACHGHQVLLVARTQQAPRRVPPVGDYGATHDLSVPVVPLAVGPGHQQYGRDQHADGADPVPVEATGRAHDVRRGAVHVDPVRVGVTVLEVGPQVQVGQQLGNNAQDHERTDTDQDAVPLLRERGLLGV